MSQSIISIEALPCNNREPSHCKSCVKMAKIKRFLRIPPRKSALLHTDLPPALIFSWYAVVKFDLRFRPGWPHCDPGSVGEEKLQNVGSRQLVYSLFIIKYLVRFPKRSKHRSSTAAQACHDLLRISFAPFAPSNTKESCSSM